MTITAYKWSIERYHQAIELGILDDQLVELFRGEIIAMSREGESHAYFNTTVKYNRFNLVQMTFINKDSTNDSPEQ
jgi:Uma2 family endonuclease